MRNYAVIALDQETADLAESILGQSFVFYDKQALEGKKACHLQTPSITVAARICCARADARIFGSRERRFLPLPLPLAYALPLL